MNAEKATCTPDGPDIALIRLLPDGRLGTGFGDGGRVVHDVGGEGNNGRAVLVQPDGRLLVGGSAARNSDTPNPGQDGTVTRFTASGSVDGSFGRSGTAIISAGTDRVRVTDIVLQPDGKVVVAGCVRCATETQDELIARLTPAGALDTSFGEGGVVVTDFPAGGWVGSNRADGVALQNDGSIAATGCGHCLFTLSITTPETVTRYLGDDVVPPQTTIDTGPSGPTNDPSPTFTFSADQQSTFECSLDRGAPTFAPCASGDSFGPLPEGAYTFRVRATDPGGNTDPTPAERAFHVDVTAPSVSITAPVTGKTYERGDVVAADYSCALAPGADDNSWVVSLPVGSCDPGHPLVIDPAALVYAGFIGGSGNDVGNGIAVDASGNAYVTGSTSSTDATFPKTAGPDLTFNGNYDAFVAKVDAAGAALVFAGFIGGSGTDAGTGVAVDASGNVYTTGFTNSTEATFPDIAGPDRTFNGGNSDAFVAKVNAAGTNLDYAGYIGGSGDDVARGVATDGSGNAYITGFTTSTEATFPEAVGPDVTANGGSDAFVAKVKAAGTTLDYAGYFGGNGEDVARGIAIDGSGNVYVTGNTYSTEATFPAAVGPDLTANGSSDAFVAKVDAAGTVVVYAGFIGGSSVDIAFGIAVDSARNAYITGSTSSTAADFPGTVGPDLTANGGSDSFVAKVVETSGTPSTTSTSTSTTRAPTTTTAPDGTTTTTAPGGTTTTTTSPPHACSPPTTGISGLLYRLGNLLPPPGRSIVQNAGISLCRARM